MNSQILIHRINVVRRAPVAQNDLGDKTYTESNVYTNIPARIEQYQPNLKYKESGQDPEIKLIGYVKSTVNLQPQDRIQAVNVNGYSIDEFIGRIKDNANALKGTTNGTHHIEFFIEETED